MTWLSLVHGRGIAVHVIASLFIGVVIRVILSLAGFHPPGLAGELAVDIAIAIGALAVPPLLTVLGLYPELRVVLDVIDQQQNQARMQAVVFLHDQLKTLDGTMKELLGGGATLEIYQVAAWVRRCFKLASGAYTGTDSNVPSEWKTLYSDLLTAQANYMNDADKRCVRILLADVPTLRSDRTRNSADFNWFVDWHKKHGRLGGATRPPEYVDLRRLDRRDARSKARELDIPLETTDMGFWEGNFALLFRPDIERQKVTMRLVVPESPEYERCRQYVDYVREESRPLTDDLPMFEEDLSAAWLEFVRPDKRLLTIGPFLLETVLGRFSEPAGEIRILDAASGIGVETVLLLKQGYYVIANEIEPALRRAALGYAKTQSVELPAAQFYSANWLEMRHELQTDAFDCVLVLGNSLCLLSDAHEVGEALENLYQTVRPGGLLVVDERNFTKLVAGWRDPKSEDEYLTEAYWQKFDFNRTHGCMYCGDSVQGAPIRMDRQRLVFAYARMSGRRPVEVIGQLSMYAFGKGQLLALLSRLGTEKQPRPVIETYSDLRPTAGPDDSADFYTYVVTKPASGAKQADATDGSDGGKSASNLT